MQSIQSGAEVAPGRPFPSVQPASKQHRCPVERTSFILALKQEPGSREGGDRSLIRGD